MLHLTIRVLVCFIVFFIFAYKINTSKLRHRRRWLVLTGIGAILLYAFIYFISVENLFITFDTPEDAYFYTHQTEKVEDIVYGQDSCLIVGEDSYGFISKKGDGYKLSSFLTFPQDIVFEKTNKGFMHVYKVSGTNDCYLWGTMLASAAIVEASDAKDSEIKVLPDQDRNEPHPVFVYGVLRHFEKGDAIYLSGVYEDIKIVLS